MGPGNQVANPPVSPAFNNLAGQGPAMGNAMPNNQQGVMYGGNANPPMQGVQMPPTNQGNPTFGKPNPHVLPSHFRQKQPTQSPLIQLPSFPTPPTPPLP